MAVRAMEQLSEWRTASVYWGKLGRESDARACIMIAEATERGNTYREASKHLMDWVDESVSLGMDKDEAIKVIYPELHRIHNSYYRV